MAINNRGDISITILVLEVIVLCAIALLSFYLVEKKEAGKIDLVFYLQEVYNSAESFRYSLNNFGEESSLKWYDIKKLGKKFVIERSYASKGIWIWSKEGETLIKVKYSFEP